MIVIVKRLITKQNLLVKVDKCTICFPIFFQIKVISLCIYFNKQPLSESLVSNCYSTEFTKISSVPETVKS